ncbi:hypothetical protein AQUCO_01700222v1 [Aquilegia coerulea]|uniref:Ataxin-10 domain-containing protein n=1 Tax=Aquilegia coerulea TaxID=218851 RepID=A0A2G5DLU0_AQUCA|nr:hypothetical protein AQUCO_01700222v1 [Aquilegia coerulea]PIA44473.1 hypothetical protein AQUCO_01700222v1 [Aquilegia coerulea]
MEDTILPGLVLPEHILQPLLDSAKCSTLDDALESLIKIARTESGRSELASKNTVLVVLELIRFLLNSLARCFFLLSLKLLRNLCAGELRNQNSFITNNGVEVISNVLNSDSDNGIVRTGLQLLGNVSLAGEEHQRLIWLLFFPDQFMEIARIRKSEICDPLCMVIYNCCSGSNERVGELCGVQGLRIVEEIIKTASIVGFGEDWLKWLLSEVCFEEHQFPALFYQISSDDLIDDLRCENPIFSEEQAFLLGVLSEVLSQHIDEVSVSYEFAMCVLGILKKAVGSVDFFSTGKSALPTGVPEIDVLGYSLTILRDVCAKYDPRSSKNEGSIDIVDSMLSSGLLELLLNILRDLEPPEIIRKSISQNENEDTSRAQDQLKRCPYKGFRRDIIAIIGNCSYERKHAQDEVRQRDGILLLMQQCVIDEDNPFLKEWGTWLSKNLFETNVENSREVAELVLQDTVDVPELAKNGLRVMLDPKTRRPKLVNA